MLSVARLTLVHNRGADLVEELSDLVADAPGEQLQKMIEDHARDRLELESVTPVNPGDFLADYVPASLLSRQRDDIKALSRSVTSAVDEVGRYLATDSRFPLLGTQEAYCALGSVFAFDGVAYNAYCGTDTPLDLANLPEASTAPAAIEDAPAAEEDPDALASKIDQSEQLSAADALPSLPIGPAPLAPVAAGAPGCPDYFGYPDLAVGSGSTLDKWTTLFRREIDVMRCARTLTYDPSVQSFGLTSQLDELKRRVGYYALWILPALYGAMGAVMYHMRWVLDPLLPHPSLLRLAHRIVLGALAGIVLGWFYSPGTAISDAADRVGFSLFVVAFFFGFSLDIFFALLDRLVIRSEAVDPGRGQAPTTETMRCLPRCGRGRPTRASRPRPRTTRRGRRARPPKEPVTFSRSAAHPAEAREGWHSLRRSLDRQA